MMDLVSEISYSNKTCNAKSESTIESYLIRQEIAAYHTQLVYHENNLPTPKNTDRLILGNPVRDSLEKQANISSNINDENQRMVTRAIGPVLPLNYLQQKNRRIISPEHVMKNHIKTQSNNRDHQDMVTKTVSPIPALSCLQQSSLTIIDPEQASCSRNPRRTPKDPNSNITPFSHLQQSNQTIINPEQASCSRNPRRTPMDPNSNITPFSYLQQSNQTIIDPEQASCSRNPRRTPKDPNSNITPFSHLQQSNQTIINPEQTSCSRYPRRTPMDPNSNITPFSHLQQSNQTIINPEQTSCSRYPRRTPKDPNSNIAPLSYLRQSHQTIIGPEQTSCSSPRRTPMDPNSNNGITKYLLPHSPRENVGEYKFAEKTTYCRPAVDMYSKQYIHKTVQKNARLQVLVKRLALIREKEKNLIAWNSFINNLKNRHILYKRSELKTISDSIPEYTDLSNSEIVENYFTNSRQSQYMLEDYHSASKNGHKNEKHLTPRLSPTFNSNGPNFTTKSQEHSMLLNFELPRYDCPTPILPSDDYPHHTIHRYYYPVTPPTKAHIYLDETGHQLRSNESHKRPLPVKFIDVNKSEMRTMSVHTNTSVVSAYKEEINPDKSLQDKYGKNNSSVENIKKIVVGEVEVKYNQLSTIDRKLDELICSINNFIDEIKSQKHLINMTTRREAINQTKSSSCLVDCNLKRGEIKCRMMQDKAISNISLCKGNPQETLYTILTKEMHKSDKVNRDIENIINKPNRSSSSLHITFDIPTKDGSIEIKDSFNVDPRSVCVKEISEDKRMSTAVNTEPLGLLALFRVSAEAVKQLLSFVPSIDYYSYMSMLPLPAAKHTCHYVCNICGAAFDQPSRLSDHIQRHTLGRTRDCCVCRHVLDSARQSGLFTCRHCGQKFTRAYCRELHQLSCARALGKEPEDSSSHLILR